MRRNAYRAGLTLLASALLSCHASCHAAASSADSGAPANVTELKEVAITPGPSAGGHASASPDRQATRMALKQSLEQKANAGQASSADLRLLLVICKELRDDACVERVRMKAATATAPD